MRRITLLFFVLLLSAPNALAATFDSLISFGDSLSDTGSGPATPPSYGGRFSNGPVWEEYLAGSLALPAAATHDYAIGGATSGLTNLNGSNTGLLSQVNGFVGAPITLGSSTLFTVWAGGNDAILAALSGSDPIAGASQAALNIASAVTSLHGAGAQYFLVPNLPNGGLFPITAQLGADPAQANALTLFFNSQLDAALAPLTASLGVTIFRLDAYSLFQNIAGNPGAYGLTDVVNPCKTSAGTCADPDGHLFWDNVHPTTRVHGFLGAQAFVAVPEPNALVLMLVAVTGLAVTRRSPCRR